MLDIVEAELVFGTGIAAAQMQQHLVLPLQSIPTKMYYGVLCKATSTIFPLLAPEQLETYLIDQTI